MRNALIRIKLKEHLNVLDADSHVLRILPVVSRKARKARKEKNTTILFEHYLSQLCCLRNLHEPIFPV